MIQSSKWRSLVRPLRSISCLGAQLPGSADEGDHQVQIVELLAHLLQSPELQVEEVRLLDVAVTSPVADHRVGFLRLESLATVEATELVRSEVGRSVDHRSRIERAREDPQLLAHSMDELVAPTLFEEKTRVGVVQRGQDHELRSQEPDAVDRQP